MQKQIPRRKNCKLFYISHKHLNSACENSFSHGKELTYSLFLVLPPLAPISDAYGPKMVCSQTSRANPYSSGVVYNEVWKNPRSGRRFSHVSADFHSLRKDKHLLVTLSTCQSLCMRLSPSYLYTFTFLFLLLECRSSLISPTAVPCLLRLYSDLSPRAQFPSQKITWISSR